MLTGAARMLQSSHHSLLLIMRLQVKRSATAIALNTEIKMTIPSASGTRLCARNAGDKLGMSWPAGMPFIDGRFGGPETQAGAPAGLSMVVAMLEVRN